MKSLACKYSGIAFLVSADPNSKADSKSDVVNVMRQYYTYLSSSIKIKMPVWTEPYEDGYKMGRVITVAYPIYVESEEFPGIRQVLAVAGIDVAISSLTTRF